MDKIPRMEHPRPQMQRADWQNLNGEWDFAFDFGRSGVGFRDFIPAVWYLRTFRLTEEQRKGLILLHFGAVDYGCRVWVNGKEAGEHKGGYVSFTFDITGLVETGENRITVYAWDDLRSGRQCKGKQSGVYQSVGCDYTRTTGIWQTVWLEFVPRTYYTAPEDAALEKDIRLSLAAGFNGARLHQKVFEERFLYHCDRLGYLVWGEQGSWGLDYSRPDGLNMMWSRN